MIAAFAVAALCFTACGHEGGNEEEEGGGSSNNQEYPSTTNVIRDAVTDIDGNKYDAVIIGNQVWMASNLRTTRYADGTVIPLGETTSKTAPYRYAPGTYESNEENMINVPTYGYLYNWAAVMHGTEFSEANTSGVQGICPNGWHVPSDAEWTQFENEVGRQSDFQCDGSSSRIAKALASNTGWESSSYTCAVGNNQSSNNATGFSAFPAGSYGGAYYDFDGFGSMALIWSSTETNSDDAWLRGLYYGSVDVGRCTYDKYNGFSVRCVRD